MKWRSFLFKMKWRWIVILLFKFGLASIHLSFVLLVSWNIFNSPSKWLFCWYHFLSDIFILFITNTYSHIKYLLIIVYSCLNKPLESRCKFYGSLLFCSINFTRQHSIHQFMPTLETIKSAFTGNKSLFFHSFVITFLKKLRQLTPTLTWMLAKLIFFNCSLQSNHKPLSALSAI